MNFNTDHKIEFNHEYDYKHTYCYHCRGYYGPNFNEPLCGTCHAFLCPTDPFNPDTGVYAIEEKSDEYDSGNEEPRDSQQDNVPPHPSRSYMRYPTQSQSSQINEPPSHIANTQQKERQRRQLNELDFCGSSSDFEGHMNERDFTEHDSTNGDGHQQELRGDEADDSSVSELEDIGAVGPLVNEDSNGVSPDLLPEDNFYDSRPPVPDSPSSSACGGAVRKKDGISSGLINIQLEAVSAAPPYMSSSKDTLVKKIKRRRKHYSNNCNRLKSKYTDFAAASSSYGNVKSCLCNTGCNKSQLQEKICLLSNHHSEASVLSTMLPPEVWLIVFKKLDDVSLWQCAQVSVGWRELILRNWGHDKWRRFTLTRWRFFKPLYPVHYWHSVYSSLMEASPCRRCQVQISQSVDALAQFDDQNSWRITRLGTEYKSLKYDAPEGIEAMPLDADYLNWQATIRGPDQSPYQGGIFYLHIFIPPRYPLGPPVVRFLTKIFHPNISCHGDIGIDSIQHNWSLALTISKVLISIQSLLTDPFTKVCMDERAGALYDKDRAKYDLIAKEWTWRFAMVDTLQPRISPHERDMCDPITSPLEQNFLPDNSPVDGEEDGNEQDNLEQAPEDNIEDVLEQPAINA